MLAFGLLAFGRLGRPFTGYLPRMSAVDGLSVHFQPVAHFDEPLLHDDWDASISRRADVEQQVATLGDQVDQHADQAVCGLIVINRLVAIVAEAGANAAALLELASRTELRVAPDFAVFGRVIAAVMTAGILAPAVVDHHLVAAGRLSV